MYRVSLEFQYNFRAEQRVLSYLIRQAVSYMTLYYMALSHKHWELPNSRIWLAEVDIDRDLNFPI